MVEARDDGMPEEVRSLFEALAGDLTWLHVRWRDYSNLFRRSAKRVELLNESAPAFFYVVQEVFVSDVITGVCRMLDRPRMGDRDNLTLGTLVQAITSAGMLDFVDELRPQLEDLGSRSHPLRVYRNRVLSHRDLGTVLRADAEPLPSVTVEAVEACLAGTVAFMNTVSVHFGGPHTEYASVSSSGDAEALVARLIRAEDYKAAQREGVIPIERLEAARYRGA